METNNVKIFDDLYYFYKIVRYGSLSKASKALGIEQGTLSYALKRLEEKLNNNLLVRKKTGVELSAFGKTLYNSVVNQYSSLDHILDNISTKETPELKKSFKILTTTGTLSLLIVPAIKKFIEKFPNLYIEVETFDGEVTFNETNADAAVLPTVDDVHNVTKRHLRKIETNLYISKSYIKQYGEPKKIEDFKNHKFIGYYTNRTGYKGDVDWHLKLLEGHTPLLRVNSAIVQLYAAQLGLGITSLPANYPFINSEMKKIFFEKSACIDVYYIYRRDQNNPYIDKFYNILRAEFDKFNS